MTDVPVPSTGSTNWSGPGSWVEEQEALTDQVIAATPEATPDTLVKRDSAGRIRAADGSAAGDLVTRAQLDAISVGGVTLAELEDEESAANAVLSRTYLPLSASADFAAAPNRQIKRVTTSRTNATIAADPDLLATFEPNSDYMVEGLLLIDGESGADFKCKWSLPAGTTMRWHMLGPPTTASTTTSNADWAMKNETDVVTGGTVGSGTTVMMRISGVLTSGDVGGTAKLQWAPNVAPTTNGTNLQVGSNIALTRIGTAAAQGPVDPTNVTIPYTQAFTGLSAWPTEWVTGSVGSGTATVAGGVATLAATAVDPSAAWAYLGGMPNTPEVDVTADFTTPATLTSSLIHVGARSSGVFNDRTPDSGYWVQINPAATGGTIALYRAAATTADSVALTTDVARTWAASTTYRVRLKITGTTIQARVWATSGAEPTTWQLTATDSTYDTGRGFLMFSNGTTAAARSMTFDNFTVAVGVPDAPSGGGVVESPISYNNLNEFQLEGNTVRLQTPNQPWSFRAVSDARSLSGATYSRHEMRQADSAINDGRQRCELRYLSPGSGGYLPYGVDIWVSYAFKWSGALPSGGGYCIMSQFNQAPDSNDISPRHAAVFHVEITSSGFTVSTRGDTAANSTNDPGLTRRYTGALPTINTWTHMVYRVRLSKTLPSGELQIWRNGTQVTNVSGIVTAYNDTRGPYFKYGIYRERDAATTVIEYANPECSLTSLAARVTTPLALPNLP